MQQESFRKYEMHDEKWNMKPLAAFALKKEFLALFCYDYNHVFQAKHHRSPWPATAEYIML